ncbi:MAG: DUF1598 domain-containing protein [Planctomycetia bacterium]
MSCGSTRARFVFGSLLIALAIMGLTMSLVPQQALAQGMGGMGGMGFGQAVGGVSIDAGGIVRNLDPAALETLAAERRAAIGKARAGGPADLRKVSLRRLIAAVEASKDKPLTPEVLFLGGLTRVTHLFVDPEGHDLILAGPAEVIAIDAAGNAVGAASKRPLLHLEDFIAALRSIDAARAGGIQCSIDPTPEGLTKLQAFLRNQRGIGGAPDATLRGMEEALGPQTVRVEGVRGDTRFARVLVAADYRMKRIGMGLEPSGVSGLPSYLSMVPAGRPAALPRFWLEPSYDPISRDPDELAWRINGRRMSCLTESDLLAKDGVQRGRGAADGIATKWCAAMTSHYDALAAKQPIFAELINCVDLAVVAALIHGRQLHDRAGLDLGPLLDEKSLPLPSYEVAKTVPTVATAARKGNAWVVSASGGVQYQPWAFAAETADAADLTPIRTASVQSRPADAWNWD